MLKIAILEDEQVHAQHLLSLLERYAQAHPGFTYNVVWYDRSLQMLSDYRCDADLLLLDIQMPDMLGMEVAKRIRERDAQVMIVFITTLTQYAIEGYSVGAFDYVLKPVNERIFTTKMDRVRRFLGYRHSATTLEIRTKEMICRVPADEVTYLEVASHDVLIHTLTQTYRQWGSLKKYEELLCNDHFVRCNACYLVNLRYVHGIEGDMVRVHQDRLAISKPKRKEFLMAVAQYKGGSR